jgi:hypothetical protein
MHNNINILTVNVQRYSFTDSGWYTVAGYAEVNSGLSSVKPPKFQVVTGIRVVCQQESNNKNNSNNDDSNGNNNNNNNNNNNSNNIC